MSCIKLFEKEKNVIIFLNISLILSIILVTYTAFFFFPTHYIYYPENLIFAAFLLIYLIIININKINYKNVDDIDEIGKVK